LVTLSTASFFNVSLSLWHLIQPSLDGIGVGDGAAVGLVTGVAVGVGTVAGDAQATMVSAITVANSTLTQRKSDIVRPFKKKAKAHGHSSTAAEEFSRAPLICPDARKTTVFRY
jgi:hypothetical protein